MWDATFGKPLNSALKRPDVYKIDFTERKTYISVKLSQVVSQVWQDPLGLVVIMGAGWTQ